MAKHYKLFLPGLMVFLISGCSHVISGDLRANVDSSLTFTQVLENPAAYKGNSVVWG